MRKISIFVVLFFLLASSNFVGANTIAGAELESPMEGSETELHEELKMEEKLRLLTETAIKYEIPPEILKAIALAESNMLQFEDGKPFISDDNGIGIMQVTHPNVEVNQEKLKYDTAYNIEVGAQILKDKWNLQFNGRIPKINDSNPKILENWYFAIMAYNGLSFVNDPNKKEELKRIPYQETVYGELEKYSQIEIAEFPAIHINYDELGTMQFPDKKLIWEKAKTETTQMFVSGDSVFVMNSLDPNKYPYANLRAGSSLASPPLGRQAYYTELEIISGPYIGSSSEFNQFVMYEVKGSDFTGYIASSNLRRKSTEIEFKQWEEKKSSDVRKKWTITLNKSLNQETVNPRNVYIVDASGKGIFTKLTYHKDNQTIVVEPESPYKSGEKYELRIKGLVSNKDIPLKESILMPFSIQ